jgi:hypothetical protein
MDWLGLVEAAASVATAFGVTLTGIQIRLAKQAARTNFEDDLTKQYREIIRNIPIEALLGQELDEETWRETLDDFYRYIDLSNEQVFLRQKNRVSRATWELWCEGIQAHLTRPSFRKAWQYFKEVAPDSFRELQLVELGKFKTDPRTWHKDWEQGLDEQHTGHEKLLDK